MSSPCLSLPSKFSRILEDSTSDPITLSLLLVMPFIFERDGVVALE